MNAIIVTIGDELLIGQTIDTNSAWMGFQMSQLGFDVEKKMSIHDRREDILGMLHETMGKYDVVLMTGGLGPTSDDITKPTLCEFFDTKLVLDEEVLEMVKTMLSKRGIAMTDNNTGQAMVPERCEVLKNHVGTAPGMWFEKENTIFVSMPGVPFEMKYLMTEYVLPRLKERFRSQSIIHKTLITYGIAESLLSMKLTDFEASLPDNIKLAYLPDSGIIKLRLTCVGTNRVEVEKEVESAFEKLGETVEEYVISREDEPLEKMVAKLLMQKDETVGTTESCTGGNIARCITSMPGSSKYYMGSIVSYSNDVKNRVLGVPEEALARYGAVSKEVVEMMAKGGRKVLRTDYVVATSGIAGPDGGSDEKPVGTVWIAVSSKKGTVAKKFVYGRDRSNNIERFTKSALNMLREEITK